MTTKRYVLSHRHHWHKTNGYTTNTVRVFDAATGQTYTSPRWTGSATLGSIYARAEELTGAIIETSQAWVDSVEVSSRSRLHVPMPVSTVKA